jgi:predicted DNA-binding transcriptional regulator AlpA
VVVAKKIAAREVPYVRLGRAVRFSEEHIRDIIESHTTELPSANGRGSARTAL